MLNWLECSLVCTLLRKARSCRSSVGKMGSVFCIWIWLLIGSIILLGNFRSFPTMRNVSGMSPYAHSVFWKESCSSKQLTCQPLLQAFVRHADRLAFASPINERRKLTVIPEEGSSRREVEALIAFKDSVTADPLGVLKSWKANASDACDWVGVQCSTWSKNVADLTLRSLGLVGIVPQMIGFLNYLERMDLSNNFLSGSIPDSIANCSNLSYLNVSENQIVGGIPFGNGELFHLRTLDATGNNLTGLIPDAIGNCSSLEILRLGSNFLDGPIPLTLGELSSLNSLSLRENILFGTIPRTLGNCSSLASLKLYKNYRLGGELPEELNLLMEMQVLNLQKCNFVGVFPTWVTNLTSISEINLIGNRLSGEIPEVIGQLAETLTSLALSGNQFTGKVPSAIANCTELVFLYLDNNQITGDILSNIGVLRNLEDLALSINNISGVIPPSISNCSALQKLELGYNPMSRQTIPSWIGSLGSLKLIFFPAMNLYGEIPANLGQLSSLGELLMWSNHLGGVLPTSLGNLSLLYNLDFGRNQLLGDIPLEITGNLSFLRKLQLDSNFFVGSLPSFSNLNNLTRLGLQSNMLTGTIDSDIGVRAPFLVSLGLDGNDFSGHMPDGIGNFSNLVYMGLSTNSLGGSIPASWGNLTRLGNVDVSRNEVDGVIPATLMSCTQLSQLILSENKIKGPVPQEIGQLVNLQELVLEENFISGALPSSLGNLSKMGTLRLSYNRFSGVIFADTLSKMAGSLTEFDVSHNFLSGSLPAELHLLTNLRYLDVSANNISGSLVPGLATCIVLAYLDLSLNKFTGALPADLGLLQDLQFFNASFNKFDGSIPSSGLFLTKNITSDSFLGNPGLCGSTRLVSQQCSNRTVSAHHHCKSFKCRRIWIPVIVSISTLLVLGIVIIYWGFLANHEKTSQDMITEFTLQGRIVLSEQNLMRIIEGGEDNVIGMGAKSIVYKGVSPEGEIFALKVLRNKDIGDDNNMDKMEELLKEAHTLAQLRHVNIIKVLGLSVTSNVKALILEYMPRGSLHDLLYSDEEVCKLSHQDRFKIILGVAESLVYLHHSFHDPIIHRDLKPSNILLGTDLEPKLGDFGISKFAHFQTHGDLEASASTICGTFGYTPPEYAYQSTVSSKGDVYSFGVILLELLTGRKPASESSSNANGDLVDFVLTSFEEKPFELLDSTLMEEGSINPTTKDHLMLLLRVGLLCTRSAPKSRPDMTDVLAMLKQVEFVGSATKTLKTVEELANEITIWDPDSTQQLDNQVPSSSS